MSKVWLVTGSANGLGRHMAGAVLAAGDRLAATARDLRGLCDLKERYGDRIVTIKLDVTDAAAGEAAVAAALAAFGRIDVLVNNAGYGQFTPFEQTGADEFHAQIDTNFYDVVNLSRAVLPTMRRQRSGRIIQISSVGGRIGTPGLSAYQAAKWAVGGFSEVLAQEVASFGIKVSVLEPGGMQTRWGMRASQAATEAILPDYQGSVGATLDLMRQNVNKASSDPARVASVILGIANHDEPPMQLLLGSDALNCCGEVEVARAVSAERWKPVSVSVDASATAIAKFPRLGLS